MRAHRLASALLATSLAGLAASTSHAEIVVTANDGKMTLENGNAVVRKQPLPDTVSVIDLTDGAPKLHRRGRQRPPAWSARHPSVRRCAGWLVRAGHAAR